MSKLESEGESSQSEADDAGEHNEAADPSGQTHVNIGHVEVWVVEVASMHCCLLLIFHY